MYFFTYLNDAMVKKELKHYKAAAAGIIPKNIFFERSLLSIYFAVVVIYVHFTFSRKRNHFNFSDNCLTHSWSFILESQKVIWTNIF